MPASPPVATTDDARKALEVKGQVLDDSIEEAPELARCFRNVDAACVKNSSLAASRAKKQAAIRDAAVAAFGRDRDAGMALLNAATRPLH